MFQMSTSAFVESDSTKMKKKSKRKKRDIEIEEILDDDKPTVSNSNVQHKKKKKFKPIPFVPATEENVEVINVDENSSDIITIENERPKKKKAQNNNIQDEVIIFEDEAENGVNGTDLVHTPSKKRKRKNSSKQDIQVVQTEDNSSDDDSYSGNSLLEGKKLFTWLINPVLPEDFFSNTWEKRPLHIKRGVDMYYKSIISTPAIDTMLRNNNIQFTKNVDVTSYRNGKRETHNPEGRAMPNTVWSFYKKGCSVRLLNPQTYISKVGLLTTTLQDYFGCFVGANAYLTPPGTQGFAPHYDDIEAFILQVEGKKHWRLYAPKTNPEVLPRFSSGNFSQDEIGSPIMEVTLEPGDLLYFPRGTIHQGNTVPGFHSLHITVSCYQRNTWGDLLEKVVTGALRVAMEEDVEFRKGLPIGYLNYMGIVHSDEVSEKRLNFTEKIKSLANKLISYAPIDAAVDQMGKQFMHDAMPPILTAEEKECSSFGSGLTMKQNGVVSGEVTFSQNTKVKLTRAHILRLVTEEDSVRLFYCVDNTLEYHGQEPQYVEVSAEMAPGVEYLISSYPEFKKISQLPLDSDDEKVTLVSDLWERGLILTETPQK